MSKFITKAICILMVALAGCSLPPSPSIAPSQQSTTLGTTIPGTSVSTVDANALTPKVLIHITTTSDWTNLRLVSGGTWENPTSVSSSPESSAATMNGNLISLTQPLARARAGQGVEMTLDVSFSDLISSDQVVFEIQRGNIGSTQVEISTYTGGQPVLLKTFTWDKTNTANGNSLEVQIPAEDILKPPTASFTGPTSTSRPPTSPKVVVIDTDMAVDDWMAILYLLQRTDVKVIAITVTGTGESHCAPGIQHALGLVALSGYDKIPVVCGREKPLQGNHTFPDSWRARVDSLLGLTLPTGQNTASNLTAAELLMSVIKSSPVKVTLLAIGPLTNVAEALQNNPSLVDNIESIYIMGGAVNVPGNLAASGANINNQVAEWNIYVDPYAANIVLRSKAPVALVPLDATGHVPLTLDFLAQLQNNHTSPEATFVFDMLTQQKQFIAQGYYFWDPLAAAILTDESLATFQNKNLCVVEKEGPESGWTKSDSGCPEVRVAISADAGRFKQIFLDTLNAP